MELPACVLMGVKNMNSSQPSLAVSRTDSQSSDGPWKTGRFARSRHGWLYGDPECDWESVRIHGVTMFAKSRGFTAAGEAYAGRAERSLALRAR